MKWSVDGFPDSLNFNYTVSNVSHINYTNSDDDVLLPPHRRTFFRWIGWWWWSWVDESFFFGFPRVKIVHWKVGNLLVGNLITDRRCRGEMFERRKKKKSFLLKVKSELRPHGCFSAAYWVDASSFCVGIGGNGWKAKTNIDEMGQKRQKKIFILVRLFVHLTMDEMLWKLKNVFILLHFFLCFYNSIWHKLNFGWQIWIFAQNECVCFFIVSSQWCIKAGDRRVRLVGRLVGLGRRENEKRKKKVAKSCGLQLWRPTRENARRRRKKNG